MKFDVLTLFPEMFETLTKSITGKDNRKRANKYKFNKY